MKLVLKGKAQDGKPLRGSDCRLYVVDDNGVSHALLAQDCRVDITAAGRATVVATLYPDRIYLDGGSEEQE